MSTMARVLSAGGRSIQRLVTSDGDVLSCFWVDNKAGNPDF